jgi:hypothetical protein
MSKTACVIICLLSAAAIGWPQRTEVAVQPSSFVPAGTLLGCTLDEPNFSSQTAQPGDPVLCRTSAVQMFGRQVIPRGAYLSARLLAYRDPGHFFGKGWIQLEFTSLTLPGGNVPLEAKIISAARYRVNGEGKVLGRGHPTRDLIEWSIPILWPVKVLTLPARGPRPAFKGETRIELRLMEDLVIPESAYGNLSGLITRSSSLLQPGSNDRLQPRSDDGGSGYTAAATATTAQGRLTLLVLRGGTTYLVAQYWLDRGTLGYYTREGARQWIPLDALDVPATRQINAERGVTFLLAKIR